MRIPDDIRKCVAFIGYDTTTGLHIGGTVLLVCVPLEGTDFIIPYIVTAKHIIDTIEESGNRTSLIRWNKKGGGTIVFSAECSNWVSHPDDKSVDVSVLPIGPKPLEGLDHLCYPLSSFADGKRIIEENIGVGDDIFITGLFNKHQGETRNIPIIRFGNISAMPEEKVRAGVGMAEAYLIEAMSIGGLSGSPVFVALPLFGDGRQRPGNRPVIMMQTGAGLQFFLLGIIHGHFDEIDSGAPDVLDVRSGKDKMNLGIGVVVPAYKILEVINQPSQVELRKKTGEKMG